MIRTTPVPKPCLVQIDYTNHRGERALRIIRPLKLEFESNEYHLEAQWMVLADDKEKNALRSFPLASIHSWKQLP